EIVHALRPGGSLADLLHSRQKQADQQRDDGDHDEQLDQCEPAAIGSHGNDLDRITNTVDVIPSYIIGGACQYISDPIFAPPPAAGHGRRQMVIMSVGTIRADRGREWVTPACGSALPT